jgi:sugar phosphate isomerase/epimerase
MDLKDFAAHVISRFQIHEIEPWTGHFPSTAPAYLEQFRSALEKAGGQVVNMSVDGEDSPYSADRAEREHAVAFSRLWIDVAATLGSPSVRTNIPEAKNSKPDLDLAADSLSRVADYAAGKNVVVSLENDNPVSEDPFFLVKLIEKVNHPWLHTLPDFGNSVAHTKADYAYRGIDAMFGKAYCICHVKDRENNEKGQSVSVDMARTFEILKRHHYQGYLSMEWDSPGDVYAGTASLIEQTARHLS